MISKTYLVTGGCGFIGSHLVDKLLAEGHNVIVLDDLSSGKRENIPARVELIVGDIRDQSLIDSIMSRVDGCFHLAAIVSVEQSNKDWLKSHSVNQAGAIQIFNSAKATNLRKPIPVVYASSAAVYGNNDHFPLKESLYIRPLTAYGADKLGCELHANVAYQVFKIPTLGFRFFNVYGPRVDPNNMYSGVISKFVDKISCSEEIIIYGDGKQSRDFVYVIDIANFLYVGMQKLMAGENNAPIYNICTGQENSINQLAMIIGEILQKEIKIQYQHPRLGDIYRSVGCPLKAKEELNMTTQYSLLEGLRAHLM